MLFNVFLKLKFRGQPGSNQGPLALQRIALPLSYIPWNIVHRQSTLSVRVYIKLVRKRSFLLLLWFFSPSCSENQPMCFKFQFPRRELFWHRDLAYRKKILFDSALQPLTFMFDTAVFVVQKLLGGSQLLFFGHHVSSWFFSNRCPDGDFRTISLVQNLGTQVRSMYSCFAHEISTTVSSLLVFHNSTKHPVFTRLHIYGKTVFFSDLTMVFFAFLLGMPTETLQFVFSTQRLVWSRELACWR